MFASDRKKGKDQMRLNLGGDFINVTYKGKKKGKGGGKGGSHKNSPPKIRTSKGIILLEGRHFCDCEGYLHEVITNCVYCGRIVCEQEGLGECYFCQKEVVDEEYNTSSKEALERRDAMVSYDKNSKQRSVVIDDQMDHFESNIWMDKTRREERKKNQKILEEKKKFAFQDEESLNEYQQLEEQLKKNISEAEEEEDVEEEGVILDPFSANFKIEGKFSNIIKKKKKKKNSKNNHKTHEPRKLKLTGDEIEEGFESRIRTDYYEGEKDFDEEFEGEEEEAL